MKRTYRMIAMICAVALILTIFPLNAFAANTGYSAAAAIVCDFDVAYTKSWTTSTYKFDCYNRIELPETGILTFRMDKPIDSKGEYARCEITVMDEDGTVYWQHNGYGDNAIKSYVQYSIGLAEGVYFVNIDPLFSVTSGTISSDYKFTFEATNDCEIEPNGSQKTANKIELGKEYRGLVGSSDKDEDWFKVSLKANSVYRIYMGNYNELEPTTWIATIQSVGGSEKSMSYNAPYDDEEERNYYEYSPDETGNYYIRSYNLMTPTAYTLKVVAIFESGAEEGKNTGFSASEAIECETGTTYNKVWIKNNYNKDCFNKITVLENGILTFDFEITEDTYGENEGYKFFLLDAEGTTVWDMYTYYDSTGKKAFSYKIGLAAGTYYMNIDRVYSVREGYITATYGFAFEASNFCERELNNSISTPTPIELGNRYLAWYGECTTPDDWFLMNLNAEERYLIYIWNYEALDKDGNVYLVYADGKENSTRYTMKYDASKDCKYYEFTPSKTDTYYIEIKGYNQLPIEYAIMVDQHHHEYVSEITKEATCKQEGVMTYTCADCGDTYTEPIPTTDHTLETVLKTPATCTEDGLTDGTKCSVCGEWIKKQETIPATGHAYGEWKEVTENEHQRVCANDASHVETAAHNWDKGNVTKQPAPGINGEKKYTCKDCGAVKTEQIVALPIETEAPTTEAPTAEAPTTKAPVTEPPTTETPVTEPPATEPPKTEPPTTESPTQYFTLGDVDMDGKIKAVDARLALRAAARLDTLTETQQKLADMDEDGKVKAADARAILRVAARLDPAPETKIPVAAS